MKAYIIAIAIFALSTPVLSESLIQVNSLVVKDIRQEIHISNKSPNVNKVRVNTFTPRVEIISPTEIKPTTIPEFNSGSDCISEGGLNGCSQMLVISSSDIQNYSIDYGMFSVIGSGIRLPDEQLESAGGLEDEGV